MQSGAINLARNLRKYEVNTNGHIKALEGEMTLLVEDNRDTDRGIKFHRSHEQLPIEPTERFRTFSDASGMKKSEKLRRRRTNRLLYVLSNILLIP